MTGSRHTNAPAPARRTSSRAKGAQDENARPAKKAASNAPKDLAERIAGHIDPYGDEMETKFNVEGSAQQEVVFLRQNHDLAEQTIREQEAANAALLKELADLKARFGADRTNQDPRSRANSVDHDQLSEELANAKAANAALKKQVQTLTAKSAANSNDDGNIGMVPRPAGSAGNNFNIQNAMGLGHNAEDRERYLAVMRNMRDITLQAGINWEQPWAKTSAAAKENLFAVARERHPILKRYVNDWATEELVKQYIKNKRRRAYQKGWLETPAQYAYLKANSAKRDPSAPRGSRTNAKADRAAVRTAKKVASKKKEATRKKSGSRKAKKLVVQDDDDDDSMSDGAGPSRQDDEDDVDEGD
ncbi:hypothetical protein C8R44DRAFT_893673 [Mycena epipterygia]|nr:hypothetical protein C8R44DRAFT_893673 [Mycena epipterygia]